MFARSRTSRINRRRRSNRSSSSSSPLAAAGPFTERLESRTMFTVLTLDPATGSYANYSALSQNYGDRVTAATQNGFKYGTAGGTTPKVVASYGGTGFGTAETWQTGYGDLKSNIFPAPNGTKFQLTLTADSAYNVTLSSFDMASFGGDYTIASLKVIDGAGHVLSSKTNQKIWGTTSPHHTHYSFATPLKAQTLKIQFDSTNAGGGGWNTGLDNVQFGQAALAQTKISGYVFNDANANGTKATTGESNLSGWRVYVDSNNNGMYDSGEQNVLTDTSGNYSFTFTTPGTYIISVQLKRGYYQTAPHALTYTIVAPGASKTNAFFGVKQISPA
jgi:hypothetical protein